MNVLDVPPPPVHPVCRLTAMFEHQHNLAIRYLEIERRNGLLQTDRMPVDLHNRHGQARLKDFAWRICEEIAEASDARTLHKDIPIHCLEELADALHFMLELDLLVGLTVHALAPSLLGNCRLENLYHEVGKSDASFDEHAWVVVENLGRAMNCLKQKPWKNTHILTDIDKFTVSLIDANYALFSLCFSLMTAPELYDLYIRKNKVNEFRIGSNY